MNGYGLAAVVVVSVTVLVVVLLWAMVRVAQQRGAADREAAQLESPAEVEELSADEEFAAVQGHNRAGQANLRQQIAEAAERARRERDGEF